MNIIKPIFPPPETVQFKIGMTVEGYAVAFQCEQAKVSDAPSYIYIIPS